MTETHFERSKLNQEPGSSSADPAELHEAWGTNYKLDVPEDILEIIHKYYPWQTWKDVSNAELSYCSALTRQKIDDIDTELAKLKELSAVLGAQYASCRAVCAAIWARAALPFYELVEQVPSITHIPSYKYLITDSEKVEIEKALKGRMEKDNLQNEVSEQSLLGHLEVLRENLWEIEDECTKSDWRLSRISHLLSRVNSMIKTLETVVEGYRIWKQTKDLIDSQMNFEDDSTDCSSTGKNTRMRSGKRVRRMSRWRYPETSPRTSYGGFGRFPVTGPRT